MSNPIGWCDKTINPITGCLNGCEYCYARRMAYRQAGRNGYSKDVPFKPTFHPDKLAAIYDLKGKGKRVFLDSMGDWGSIGVDFDWIATTLKAIEAKPEHTFLVLTKRPWFIEQMVNQTGIPENLWLGVSVTCQADVFRIEAMNNMLPRGSHRFISFEPLHGHVLPYLKDVEWAIIGMETGNRVNRIVPKKEWVNAIVDEAENWGIPLFLKDNLLPLSGLTAAQLYLAGKTPNLRQELPEAMQ